MQIYKQDNTFILSNNEITYSFSIEKQRYLRHRYFGKRINASTNINQPYFFDRGFCSNPFPDERDFSLDTLFQEYPDMNQGDFRSPAYVIQTEDGKRVTRFFYKGYKIIKGKPSLKGLPAIYTENDKEAATLCITLEDEYLKAKINLYYTIFKDFAAICRHVEIVNSGKQNLYLERLMAMSMDFAGTDYDVLTLSGSHINEKNINRRHISADTIVIDSNRGASSPQETPAIFLMEREATENFGQVWGFNFVYSGDFQAVVQTGQYNSVRVQMGMNPLTFGWSLKENESFVSPETVMVYSDEGMNKMSQTFHNMYRKRLCRGVYREKIRPILINSWEAFCFDVDEEKCLSLAKKAADLGIELFVLDDGWFKNRVCDKNALGDWVEDENKFPNGIEHLVKEINKMGMQVGIWFEPEMVSPNSDLYRKHSDWIIRSQNYEPILSRCQYVLDLSNPEVCDYVIESLSKVLSKTNVTYVKWDMNRHITDLGSYYLEKDRQRELSHRYMLGLYHILDELNKRFPNVLFEGCSSGGGRFDAGMLYYMPQTWTSDNTDAVCRMKIQYGTSLLFPPITMGAHVSAVPNHQVGRITPLQTRFIVAMSGNLGYEMDLAQISDEEKEAIKEQIKFYKSIREVIQKGSFYRLKNPQNGNEAAWNFVSEDKKTVIYCYFKILAEPLRVNTPVRLKGLDENGIYKSKTSGICYGGDELMYAGIVSKPILEDFTSCVYVLEKV
ncbi:alpha-galactosidase [Megamonas hypermegale]|uniref:alpha-galactosidase n=1 Tax=Megamonas hypermegale TaxID=158847 RepID=UPI00242FC592|nr:alpha-galactosidase [Megamonas hypermegale]